MDNTETNIIASPVRTGGIGTNVGEVGDYASIVQLAFMEPQLAGRHPFVRIVSTETNFPQGDDGASKLLPPGAVIIRDMKSRGATAQLAVLDEVWIYLLQTKSGIRAVVSGPEPHQVEAVALQINEGFPLPPAPDDSTVPIHIWNQSNGGGASRRRRLEVPSWAEIRDNYASSVQTQLDDLMAMNRPNSHGRLILWHGMPGTGKTTAIRALMSQWSSWCDSQYIIDPETAFADPIYLTDLITKKFDDGSRSCTWDDLEDYDEVQESADDRWRLLIAEDSDEFLRADARQSAGAALGRLLNLSDGILGQGSNTLILLTTNEDIRELHPRFDPAWPGLANTEFTMLSAAEANRWLNGTGAEITETNSAEPVRSPKTLAELFELRGETKRIGETKKQRQQIGFIR